MEHDKYPLLKARLAAEYLGISLSTLRRIEREGHLIPFRTPGGHRRYRMNMLDEYLEGSRDPCQPIKTLAVSPNLSE